MKNVFCEHCGAVFPAEPDSPCRCSSCGTEYSAEYMRTLLRDTAPEQALFFEPPVEASSAPAEPEQLPVWNTDPDLSVEMHKAPTIAGKTAARKSKGAPVEATPEAPASSSEGVVAVRPGPAMQKPKKDSFRSLIIILLSVAGVCLLAAGILLYSKVTKPKNSYKEAESLLQQGNYEAAIKAFTAIGGYEDSTTRLLECHYLYGMDALAKGNYDLAASELRKAGSYKNAKATVSAVYYAKGLSLLKNEDYDGARAAFQSAGDYEDAAARMVECTYLQAGSLRSEASYEAAAKLYLSLGDYSDSAEQARVCYYERGEQLLQAGSYELAVKAFRSAGSYKNSSERILECYYTWGEYYLKADLFDNAEKAFQSAGTYKDAANRISECRYRNAMKQKESGQYDRAIEILEGLNGYEDSVKQIAECRYQKALKYIEGKYYLQALEELSQLEESEEAAELAKQCYYEIGVNLFDSGSYEDALEAFLNADDYKDAAQYAKKCRAARIRCYSPVIAAAEKDALSVSGNSYSGNGFLFDLNEDGIEELILVYRAAALDREQNTVCSVYTIDDNGKAVSLWDASPLVGTATKLSGVSICRVDGKQYLAVRYEKESTETITVQDNSNLLGELWGEFASHEETRTTTTVEWTLYTLENASLSYSASAGGRQTTDSSGAVIDSDGHTPNGSTGWSSFQSWVSKAEILISAGPDASHSYNKNRLSMSELLEKCG